MNQRLLNKTIKYTLYSLVFLLPLFFLPWTFSQIALNKQILLAVLAFFLLTLWLIKIISSEKLSFTWNKITLAVCSLLLILGISTAFSGARAQSFWGMAFEPDTFFSFILYGLVFFLFANLIKPAMGGGNRKENRAEENDDSGLPSIKNVLSVFLASSGVLSVLFLIQCFWRSIFPWDFTKVSGFNPIGTVQALSLFLGSAFVILLTLISTDKKPINTDRKIGINQPKSASISGKTILKKITSLLLIAIGILLFISILIINFWVAWLGIVFATAIIIWSRLKFISASQILSVRIGLALIVLAVALIFIFIKVPTANIARLPVEATPSYKATLSIAQKTLQESPKNLILGSGPATFPYNYDLYRSARPNLTAFWQIRFNQGAAFLPTFLATGGILGIIAFLFLIIIFFWQGFKTLIGINQPKSASISGTQLAVFVGSAYFLICWFFYSINFSLVFAAFLMLGLFNASGIKRQVKSIIFTNSPQKAFLIILICVFLIVGIAVGFYSMAQKYRADLAFDRGIKSLNAPEAKIDEGIVWLTKAGALAQKDGYFRNLSQALLLKIDEILIEPALSQAEKQKVVQQAVSRIELAAQMACQINPKNSQNWLQLGSIYENLIPLGIGRATELAVSTYQGVKNIAPQDPRFPLYLGRVYKILAEGIQTQIVFLEGAEEKNKELIKNLEEQHIQVLGLALRELEEAIQLKNDFAPAWNLMEQIKK